MAIRLLALVEANTITGPGKNLLQFAGGLQAGGIDPPIEFALAVFRRAGTENRFLEIARQRSIPVYPIDESRRFDTSVLPKLRSVFREFRADVIQSHSVKSHFLVRLSGLYQNAPWVAFHHGYTWPNLRMRLYNQLDRWSLRRASLVLTVSLPFKRELVDIGVDPGRIEVVHNAIDPEWGAAERNPAARRELRAKLGIAAAEKVIVVVGRLSREKDHQTLLHAFHTLVRGHEALRPRVLIVGDGPEREAIIKLMDRLEIADRVILAGHVSSAAPYYGIADLAVLSSVSEGSPNALLEAMATRVPIVATSVGGIPEIVTHERTALLVPPSNPEALAGAMAAVLADDTLARRLACDAHGLLVAHYAPAARTQRLADAYAGVLTRPAVLR